MAKKTEPIKRQYCRDCAEITERYNTPANKPDEFILGTCRIQGIAKLLNHESCKKFKQK